MLVEDHLAKIEAKIQKEVDKAAKRFGDDFDEEQFRTTNQRVMKYQEQIGEIKGRLYSAMDNEDLPAIKQLIEDL